MGDDPRHHQIQRITENRESDECDYELRVGFQQADQTRIGRLFPVVHARVIISLFHSRFFRCLRASCTFASISSEPEYNSRARTAASASRCKPSLINVTRKSMASGNPAALLARRNTSPRGLFRSRLQASLSAAKPAASRDALKEAWTRERSKPRGEV